MVWYHTILLLPLFDHLQPSPRQSHHYYHITTTISLLPTIPMKRTPVESSESVTRRRMLRLSPGQALATLLLVATGLLWSNVQLVNVTSLPNKPSIPFVPKQHSNQSPRNINYTDGAAACLLVMDDNHRLIEWLAYHYHTLPLRYLVIAVDPRSQTQPDKILQRWNATTNKNNKNNNTQRSPQPETSSTRQTLSRLRHDSNSSRCHGRFGRRLSTHPPQTRPSLDQGLSGPRRDPTSRTDHSTTRSCQRFSQGRHHHGR